VLVDPAAPGRVGGNRVTALRWARILRQLGCRVVRQSTYDGRPADLLVALHAVRSATAIQRFHEVRGPRPVVVACTGTDLYDAASRGPLLHSLAMAGAVVVLQANALDVLPADVRPRAHVILQSVVLPPGPPPPPSGFQVCVLANLRQVKDPLLAARAAALLPASSAVRVLLLGEALDPDLAAQAFDAMQRGLRFAWLGAMRRGAALRVLQGSHALVNSSLAEGGANAVGEAIVAGVPPLVTSIPGSLGLLGADWPATFPVGDVRALKDLIERVERDAALRADLHARLQSLAPAFGRGREVECWRRLLREVAPQCAA